MGVLGAAVDGWRKLRASCPWLLGYCLPSGSPLRSRHRSFRIEVKNPNERPFFCLFVPGHGQKVARLMCLRPPGNTSDCQVRELPGKPHWWWDTKSKMDGGVLDDAEMRAFWKRALNFPKGEHFPCHQASYQTAPFYSAPLLCLCSLYTQDLCACALQGVREPESRGALTRAILHPTGAAVSSCVHQLFRGLRAASAAWSRHA